MGICKQKAFSHNLTILAKEYRQEFLKLWGLECKQMTDKPSDKDEIAKFDELLLTVMIFLSTGSAGGGGRTLTGFKPHRILNPARLPVPPLRPLW